MDGSELPPMRRCGRPTRSGKPCQAVVYGFDLACSRHATDHDREVAKAYGRGHGDGFRDGHEMGATGAKLKVEWLERRVKQLEQQLDDVPRYYQVGGHQVVEVGRYSYRWRGVTPLQVGERVLLPENWLSRMKDGPARRSAWSPRSDRPTAASCRSSSTGHLRRSRTRRSKGHSGHPLEEPDLRLDEAAARATMIKLPTSGLLRCQYAQLADPSQNPQLCSAGTVASEIRADLRSARSERMRPVLLKRSHGEDHWAVGCPVRTNEPQ
jgi:hypothetical protein